MRSANSVDQKLKYNEIAQKICNLESEIRHMTIKNNSLRVSLNYLLNKLKNYIDNHKNVAYDLKLIYDEAMALQEECEDESKSEAEKNRRDQIQNELKGQENDFIAVSMDSFDPNSKDHKELEERFDMKNISLKDSFCFPNSKKSDASNTNATNITTISRKPVSEDNKEEDLLEDIDLYREKSTRTKIEENKEDDMYKEPLEIIRKKSHLFKNSSKGEMTNGRTNSCTNIILICVI